MYWMETTCSLDSSTCWNGLWKVTPGLVFPGNGSEGNLGEEMETELLLAGIGLVLGRADCGGFDRTSCKWPRFAFHMCSLSSRVEVEVRRCDRNGKNFLIFD